MRTPKITRTRVITTLAVLTLAGCGSQQATASHPASAGHAPTPAAAAPVTPAPKAIALSADKVLRTDGFRPVITMTRAEIEAQAGAAAPAILSMSGGLSPDLTREEVVVIVDSAILSANGGRGALTAALNAKVKGVSSTAEETGGTTIVRVTGPSQAFADTSSTPAATPSPGMAGGSDATTAPAPAASAAGLTNCTGGTDHASTVWAGPSTSCPFALSVAAAYAGHGGPDTETVYSTVTGTSYVITYTVQGAGTVVATGGNGAYVQF